MIRLLNFGKDIFRRLGFNLSVEINPTDPNYFELDLYHKLFSSDSIHNKRFYNVGAGKFRHPYWTNIDYSSEWYARDQKNSKFINYNLLSLEKFPITDDSAEEVYSSHTIEHINNAAAQNFFNETYRILKPNGIFRFSTPNIDLYFRALRANDRHFFYWIARYSIPAEYKRIKLRMPMSQSSLKQIVLYEFASQVSELIIEDSVEKISDSEFDRLFTSMEYEDALNYCTSRCSVDFQLRSTGFHMNWWNEKKAIAMLKKAGFSKIYQSGYGQSFSPILRNTHLFDTTHPKISLFMEAIK